MIAINYRNLVFILLFTFFSCGRNVKIQESYQIINLLIRDFERTSILHPNFAPPPSGSYIYSKNDSLKKYMHFYNEYIKKKTIIINNEYIQNTKDEIEKLVDCKKNNNINDFKYSSNLKNIELQYLNSSKKNNITNSINENQRIDVQLSFSNIIFNKSYDKAFVIFVVKFEELNSFSSIIYLEKDFFSWKIKCERNLSIS